MKEKIADIERKNGHLEGQARAMTTTLRTAESSAKSLREETLRLKTLLAQVRTQAANDVRKRDLQIAKMKDRLNDTRRGTRPAASSIVIRLGDKPMRTTGCEYDALGDSVQSSAAGCATRTLSVDTTDFLTTLSQQLADENDSILALVRQSLSALKAIQGLPDDDHNPQTEEEAESALNPVVAPPANLESLTSELETVIQSLHELLNQPDYVPLEELAEKNEELAEKNEEINQLTQRNRVLYEEWKKAIDLLDEWNQGILNSIPTSEDPNNNGPTPDPATSATATKTKGKGKGRSRTLSTHSRAGNESGLEAHLLQSKEVVIKSVKRVRATDPQFAPEPEPQVARESTFEPQPLLHPYIEERHAQEDRGPEREQEGGEGGEAEEGEEGGEAEGVEGEIEEEGAQEQGQEQEQRMMEDKVVYEEKMIIARTKSPAPSPHPQLRPRRQIVPSTSSNENATLRSPYPKPQRGAPPLEEPEPVPEPEPMITAEEPMLEPRSQPVRQRLSKPAPVALSRRRSLQQTQPQPESEGKATPEPMEEIQVQSEPVKQPTVRSQPTRLSVPEQPSVQVSPRQRPPHQLHPVPKPEPEPVAELSEPVDEAEVTSNRPEPKTRSRKPRPSLPEATPRRQSRRQQQTAPGQEAEAEATIATSSPRPRARQLPIAQSPTINESPVKLRLRRPPVAQPAVISESPARLKLRPRQPLPAPEAKIDTHQSQPLRRSRRSVTEPGPKPADEVVIADELEPEPQPELSDHTSRKRRRSERIVSGPVTFTRTSTNSC